MKKIIALILAVLMLTGCAAQSQEPEVSTTVPQTTVPETTSESVETVPQTQTITDTQGRTLELPYEINGIICLGPSALRIACYLNAQDLVVGIEDAEDDCLITRPYNYANQQLRQLPIVSSATKSGLTPTRKRS